MRAEELEVARRLRAAAEADDREADYALLADDVVFTTPHRTLTGLAEVREKLKWGGPKENLDTEVERGEWEDLGGGRVARSDRVTQRWKETGEVASVMLVREELLIRDGKVARYERSARPE